MIKHKKMHIFNFFLSMRKTIFIKKRNLYNVIFEHTQKSKYRKITILL